LALLSLLVATTTAAKLSSDSSSSDSSSDGGFLHAEPLEPPHCNAAYAATKYTKAVLAFLSTDGDGSSLNAMRSPKYFTHEEYLLNNRTIEKPTIYSNVAVAAHGFHVSARFLSVSAPTDKSFQYKYELRLASITNGPHDHQVLIDLQVLVLLSIDYNCRIATLAMEWLVAEEAQIEPLHALFEPIGAVPCPKGELRLNETCTPISCDSPRACPKNACRTVPADEDGVSFVCGCTKGYELNGHTLRCEIVTCDVPTACPPYAKCVPKTAEELLGGACEPTTSMSQQWVRGSKPCPRFNCV